MQPAQERLATRPARARVPRPGRAAREQRRRRGRAHAATECRDGLVRQVSAAVRWQESVERLGARGRHDASSRSAPGSVLCGLSARSVKGARVLDVESPESLEATLAALGRRGGGVMGSLAGRVSLVTGASRGIGRAIARALAAEGAHVVLAARDAARLEEALAEIRAGGGPAEALALDVADRASVEAAVAAIVARHGRIDHLVNNAGITRDNLLAAHEGRGVAAGARHEPDRRLPVRAGRAQADAEAALRPHRQRHLGRGPGRQRRPGQLRREQGGHRGLHQVGGARGGLAGHHRERGRARASSRPT